MIRWCALVLAGLLGCRSHLALVSAPAEDVHWSASEVSAAARCSSDDFIRVQGQTGERDDRKEFELNFFNADGGLEPTRAQFYVVRSWLTEPMIGEIIRADLKVAVVGGGHDRVVSGTLATNFAPLAASNWGLSGFGFKQTSLVFKDVPIHCVEQVPLSLAARRGFLAEQDGGS